MAVKLLLLSHPALFPEMEEDNFCEFSKSVLYWHKKRACTLDVGKHSDIIPQSPLFTYDIRVLTSEEAIICKKERIDTALEFIDKRKLIKEHIATVSLWEYGENEVVFYWGLVYIGEEKPKKKQYKKHS